MPEYRAHFDAVVEFANGGDLVAHGFRLDLPSPDLDETAIGRLFIRHLGLALVGTVRLERLAIVEEPHRGSRGVDPARRAEPATGRRIVDLSHPIRAGLITYPGLPAPRITPHLTREASRERYAPGTEFAMDVIEMIGNTGTYLDSPFPPVRGRRRSRGTRPRKPRRSPSRGVPSRRPDVARHPGGGPPRP